MRGLLPGSLLGGRGGEAAVFVQGGAHGELAHVRRAGVADELVLHGWEVVLLAQLLQQRHVAVRAGAWRRRGRRLRQAGLETNTIFLTFTTSPLLHGRTNNSKVDRRAAGAARGRRAAARPRRAFSARGAWPSRPPAWPPSWSAQWPTPSTRGLCNGTRKLPSAAAPTVIKDFLQ